MESTAKVIPFPTREAPVEAPATEQPKGRVAITWEVICETKAPLKGAPHIHKFDLTQTGFGFYVTSTDTRSYFVECPELQPDTQKWKRVRVKFRDVGKHEKARDGKRDVEQARAEGILLLKAAERGEPISKGAKEAAAKIAAAAKPAGAKTFKAAWLRYRAEATGRNGKPLRPHTLVQYDASFERLADWHDLPLFSITHAMVSAMVTKLRQEAQERMSKRKGSPKSKHTTADSAMKLFRAVWKFFNAETPSGTTCPVEVLKPQKKTVKLKRRTRMIEEEWARDWWHKLEQMTVLKDHWGRCWWEIDWVLYFRAVYLVGGRMSEIQHAEWKHIDFERGTWRFPGDIGKAIGLYAGNKTDHDHVVYMGAYLAQMMREHFERVKGKGHKYVFTDAAGRRFRKVNWAIQQFRQTFPDFPLWSTHDMRRTFLTLTDDEDLNVPLKIKKVLVNHEAESEVTLGYIVAKASKVRAWAEKMQIELLKRVGVTA